MRKYNEELSENSSINNLGIVISQDGGFKEHIANIIGKIRKKMSYFNGTFKDRLVDISHLKEQ